MEHTQVPYIAQVHIVREDVAKTEDSREGRGWRLPRYRHALLKAFSFFLKSTENL